MGREHRPSHFSPVFLRREAVGACGVSRCSFGFHDIGQCPVVCCHDPCIPRDSRHWVRVGSPGHAKILPFLCLKLCILLGLFDSFFFKNLAPERFCKNFVSVGFIPIGWSARTGRERPGRQTAASGGQGAKHLIMNPALQLGSQKGALPRKRRKRTPRG